MISIDDYNSENYKIAELAFKNKIQGEIIFFLDFPNLEAERSIKILTDLGCQIGSHTMSHADLTSIPLYKVKQEIEDSKKLIESLTGKECSWLAYPYGFYNQQIIEILNQVGYKYARTTHLLNLDSPFEISSMHIGRIPDYKYGNCNSYEIAKRTNFKHFYTHYVDLFKDKKDSFEQLDKFMSWYAKNRN